MSGVRRLWLALRSRFGRAVRCCPDCGEPITVEHGGLVGQVMDDLDIACHRLKDCPSRAGRETR